jgi:hypothetical protein
MELISMLFALTFLALFATIKIIYAYSHELRYVPKQFVHKFTALLPVFRNRQH